MLEMKRSRTAGDRPAIADRLASLLGLSSAPAADERSISRNFLITFLVLGIAAFAVLSVVRLITQRAVLFADIVFYLIIAEGILSIVLLRFVSARIIGGVVLASMMAAMVAVAWRKYGLMNSSVAAFAPIVVIAAVSSGRRMAVSLAVAALICVWLLYFRTVPCAVANTPLSLARDHTVTLLVTLVSVVVYHSSFHRLITSLSGEIQRRSSAEAILRESEERFRELVDVLPVTVFEADTRGKFTFVNKNGLAMFGYTEDDLAAGISLPMMVPERNREMIIGRMKAVAAGAASEQIEHTARRKDGTEFSVIVSVRPLQTVKGPGIRGIVVDINERKLVEEQRLAVLKAEKLMSLGELSAGLAHELAQPLSAIMLSAGTLRKAMDRGPVDAKFADARIGRMLDCSNRMKEIIDHVRLFSRGQRDERVEDFSVITAVENALSLIGAQIADRGIQVNRSFSGTATARGNTYRFEQVVLNILSNARDAFESSPDNGRGGSIDITIEACAPMIRLSIADNGPGIPAEIIGKIFDPFFTTKPVDKGTGLGLSVSYGIIKDMGGTISAESTPGVRTVFTVAVPSV